MNAPSVHPPASRETIKCRRGELSKSGSPKTSRCKVMQALYSSMVLTSRTMTSAAAGFWLCCDIAILNSSELGGGIGGPSWKLYSYFQAARFAGRGTIELPRQI